MAYRFASTQNHRYEKGDFFLGEDDEGWEIGITTERHMLTVAGSRSGKGVGLIIPNLLRWPHNALVIDPKGENAAATWRTREAMGQRVYVLDPFKEADVPARLRASCNLLAALDPAGPTAREDIRVIADGMVKRYKAEDGMWDNGAVSVLAGVIAYICSNPELPGYRTLPAVRQLLTLPDELRKLAFEAMAKTDAFGGLCKAAAQIGLSDSKKNKDYTSSALDHSDWLDSAPMQAVLGDGFNLSELKTGKATVFLVLPPKYLDESAGHGRFLRLFVRAALNAMSNGLTGKRCLFLLDEFFALGRIDQIAVSAGLMPGYGVQLWPFVQDLGQLVTLYGHDGAHTFFGNSDGHVFFGNNDAPTLDYISHRIGAWTTAELGSPPQQLNPGTTLWTPTKDNFFASTPHVDQRIVTYNQNVMADYAHAQRRVGLPRMPPDEVRELVAKKDRDNVARNMIVFAKGKAVLRINLAPYFNSNYVFIPEFAPMPPDRDDIRTPPPFNKVPTTDTEPPERMEGWIIDFIDDDWGLWMYYKPRVGERVFVWSFDSLERRKQALDLQSRKKIFTAEFCWPQSWADWRKMLLDHPFWQNWRKHFTKMVFAGYSEEYRPDCEEYREEIEEIEHTIKIMEKNRAFYSYYNREGVYLDAYEACMKRCRPLPSPVQITADDGTVLWDAEASKNRSG